MKTRASIKSHPIHPMLIAFPIAFLVGGFLFDLLGILTGVSELWTTGGHLVIAGVVMGVVAAVPGIVDYVSSVPPESSAKSRGLKHGLSNSGALLLFGIAWWLRGAPAAPPGPGVLLLQLAGVGFLAMGGWMGATLVYRNFIGPDHRYAGAGKWSESSVSAQEGLVTVATADELEVNQMKLVHAAGRRIVIGRTEDAWVAFEDRCTHRGGTLAGGVLSCGTVQCLWHGSRFDVSTGQVKAGPADAGIETFPVELVDGKVRLRL